MSDRTATLVPLLDAASAALAVRDTLLPLPGRQEGYCSVLLLGTTGAGKTTLVRQLLGTHPKQERFPPTSTAKTTVAETELVLTDSEDFRTVITFVSELEVRQHLEENVLAAAVAALQGKDDHEVVRRLLDHVDQRFRFSYVLGHAGMLLPQGAEDDLEDDDEEEEDDLTPGSWSAAANLQEQTARTVRWCLSELRHVVTGYQLGREELQHAEADGAWVQEALESSLDLVLQECGTAERVVELLLREIRRRFAAFDVGDVTYTQDAWPLHWLWSSTSRPDFIRVIGRFTSNYAKAFGALLTPLVNGVRVAGPFKPTWAEQQPHLVLIDGEGLGHVPGSVAALSSFVTQRLDAVDAVLLVDNACMPMQAAPVAALKCVAVSGNVSKLVLVFTHFDQVKGDNLPTTASRVEHVLASVDNVLNAVGRDIGATGEHHLRTQVQKAHFLAGGLHTTLKPEKKAAQHTLQQLRALLAHLAVHEPVPQQRGAMPQPVFERTTLTLAVLDATQAFHRRWRGLLGLQSAPEAPKQHWARIKALTRRVAAGEPEYRNLRPAGELSYALQQALYRLLQEPVEWRGGEPTASQRQEFLDRASVLLTRKLVGLTLERMVAERRGDWLSAYEQKGPGSTRVRAQVMEDDIYERAAPSLVRPSMAASSDLVRAVTQAVDEVADQLDFVLRH